MFIFSTLIFWTLQLLFGYFLFLFFKCNQIYQTSFSTIKTTCLPSRKIRLLDEINNKRFTQKLYTGFKRERVFLNDRKQKLIFSFSQFYLSSVSSLRVFMDTYLVEKDSITPFERELTIFCELRKRVFGSSRAPYYLCYINASRFQSWARVNSLDLHNCYSTRFRSSNFIPLPSWIDITPPLDKTNVSWVT